MPPTSFIVLYIVSHCVDLNVNIFYHNVIQCNYKRKNYASLEQAYPTEKGNFQATLSCLKHRQFTNISAPY